MNVELYRRCEKAFLKEIAKTAAIVLGRQAELTDESRNRILNELLFGVSAHLSGSSFGGRVDGAEVYPILAYWLGEGDGALLVEGVSSLHEQASEVVEEFTSDG